VKFSTTSERNGNKLIMKSKGGGFTTSACVYEIRCPCGANYVGYTIQKLRTRMLQHANKVKNFKPVKRGNKSVHMRLYEHFQQSNHDFGDITWTVLYVTKKRGAKGRKRDLLDREGYFQHERKSVFCHERNPKGLNVAQRCEKNFKS